MIQRFAQAVLKRFTPWLLAAGIVLPLRAEDSKAKEPKPEPAEIKISGYGLLGNLDLKRTLRLLHEKDKPPEFLDANFIEDAVLILFSKVIRDGHLRPRITATITLEDGTETTYEWEQDLTQLLPRPIRAKQVHFRIEEGLLYFYDNISFSGLRSMDERKALGHFIEAEGLIPLKGTRIYTPARLDQSLANLTEALVRQGFESARATVEHLEQNDETGAIRVAIKVEEGIPTTVRSVRKEVYPPDAESPETTTVLSPNEPFSRYWLQDLAQELRAEQFHLGHPDATVEITTLEREEGADSVQTDLLAKVRTGPLIRLGEVRFEGHERTRESVMRNKVGLAQGEILDRIQAERGRNRLLRLGIFESIGLRYQVVDEGTRDVIYEVDEGKVVDVSLLFGYGSYERLRAGVEIEQFNVLGLAHHQRLRLIQSFKASSADYLYTIPDIIGEDVDGFFKADALRREEVSFVRQEFGGSIGARRYFPELDSDIGLRYNYQFLSATDTEGTIPGGDEEALVASFILDFKHDKRDNPLIPRRGHRVFSSFEFASATLGGDVDFQRFEVGASYHHKLGGGRFLHLGLSHGVTLTLGGDREDLPFNKRFFPGGENSVRGFQQGEASPLNASGESIGAETFLQGNVEFEQMLTPAWSIVFFVDGIGFAEDINDYPFDETLFSAGLGIRWKTLIGPARLEYGHNLNPRKGDPAGTVHFSIGFPF